MQFPTVTARNLMRRQVTLPDDLEGELNILLIAFQQWQQSLVDTWLPFAKQIEERQNRVRYYELPVIRRMNPVERMFINEGMRAGIPDQVARERTVTLYLDKIPFREELGLSNEEEIYVLLVDRQGQVFWQTSGAFMPEKGQSLTAAIQGAS